MSRRIPRDPCVPGFNETPAASGTAECLVTPGNLSLVVSRSNVTAGYPNAVFFFAAGAQYRRFHSTAYTSPVVVPETKFQAGARRFLPVRPGQRRFKI